MASIIIEVKAGIWWNLRVVNNEKEDAQEKKEFKTLIYKIGFGLSM